MEDKCVCCGEVIPEGRQVCPQCETKARKENDYMTRSEILDKPTNGTESGEQ